MWGNKNGWPRIESASIIIFFFSSAHFHCCGCGDPFFRLTVPPTRPFVRYWWFLVIFFFVSFFSEIVDCSFTEEWNHWNLFIWCAPEDRRWTVNCISLADFSNFFSFIFQQKCFVLCILIRRVIFECNSWHVKISWFNELNISVSNQRVWTNHLILENRCATND